MKSVGKIRSKIILVVIPILVLTSVLIGITAYFSSKNGITGIAKEFLGYKLTDIYKDATRRYGTLEAMGDDALASLLESTKYTVGQYASTVIASETGGFIALNKSDKTVDFMTFDELDDKIVNRIFTDFKDKETGEEKTTGWLEFTAAGESKVGVFTYFTDWNDYFVILEDRDTFYSNVNEIVNYLLIILGSSIAVSTVILLIYIARITAPINQFVSTIQEITSDMDMTQRVKIHFKDEIGVLGQYFNNMISELEAAYNQIKNYAYQTVLAKKKEERVRFIFQKYVPQEVINAVLNVSQDSMLIGNRQEVSILFSDIRSFTTISESMEPEELVLSLNSYFNEMVSIIMKNHGVIDKFIGDAIMAEFGAPLQRDNDPENAVRSAILMFEALDRFNENQSKLDKVNFNIGVGINTGECIVGNIGSEEKIEYTVIGDTVNLASRLEGLTKKYHSPIVISQFTKDRIEKNKFYYRELDNVRVKGKKEPVKIFLPMDYQKGMAGIDFYNEYHQALNLYYQGHFQDGKKIFEKLLKEAPKDELCKLYLERCEILIQNPPTDWDGVETFTTK